MATSGEIGHLGNRYSSHLTLVSFEGIYQEMRKISSRPEAFCLVKYVMMKLCWILLLLSDKEGVYWKSF